MKFKPARILVLPAAMAVAILVAFRLGAHAQGLYGQPDPPIPMRYQQVTLPQGCEAVSAAPGRSLTTAVPGTPEHPGAGPMLLGVIVTCRDGRVFLGALQ